ncbi:hypothetical protein NBRC116493_13420 [Aurantivibrio infirmus]
MKTAIAALSIAILIQLPLGYFFISLESLVLGHGFIDIRDGVEFYLLAALIIAAAVIIFLGMPTYFTLKHFKYNSTLNVAFAGFVIPALILSFLNFGITDYQGYSAGENYYGTYRATFSDGNRTFWGWVKFLEGLATYGIHGILGAITFHIIYVKQNA